MFYIFQSDCQFVELDLFFDLNFFYDSTRLFVGKYGMSDIDECDKCNKVMRCSFSTIFLGNLFLSSPKKHLRLSVPVKMHRKYSNNIEILFYGRSLVFSVFLNRIFTEKYVGRFKFLTKSYEQFSRLHKNSTFTWKNYTTKNICFIVMV